MKDMHPEVVIESEGDDIRERVFSLLDRIGKSVFSLDNNSKVCIKPNICIMKKANTGATTDPIVVSYIVDYILASATCSIFIVESDATINYLNAAYGALGWNRLAKEKKVSLVNLSQEPTSEIDVKGYYFTRMIVPTLLQECDLLISVPKLKVHEISGISGALKNQFGCLPKRRKSVYHRRLAEVIADVNRSIRPELVLTDAIVTLKGGAITGIPVHTNMLFGSTDPVANDAFCAKLAGLTPRKIRHISLSEKAGVGSTSYKLRGNIKGVAPLKLTERSILNQLTNAFLSLTS